MGYGYDDGDVGDLLMLIPWWKFEEFEGNVRNQHWQTYMLRRGFDRTREIWEIS